jgi:hypothetical protein
MIRISVVVSIECILLSPYLVKPQNLEATIAVLFARDHRQPFPT